MRARVYVCACVHACVTVSHAVRAARVVVCVLARTRAWHYACVRATMYVCVCVCVCVCVHAGVCV